jgi:hypothetical protein
MGDLSQNFSISEMVKSQTALRHGIDNLPDDEAILNMDFLANAVLQPIRDNFAAPVTISSGYRCLELNRKLGSKDSSQHRRGEAADIEIWGISNLALGEWIRDNLIFDQLILEFYDGVNPSSGWVHVSFTMPIEENRMEVLTINRDGAFNGFI